MKSRAGSIGLGALLALAAGCTTRPLQPGAGGGGGPIGIDGGATADGGASAGAQLFRGRRSFVVTSTVTLAPGADGGLTGGPMSQTFTMVVDGDAWTAITGPGPYPYFSQLEPAPGGFRFTGFPPAFSICPDCGAIRYTDLSFRFDPAGRLLGSGSGNLVAYCSTNATIGTPVTMSLSGVADTVAPTLAFLPFGDLADPFVSFQVLASEALPADAQPVLRGAEGDVVMLTPSSSPNGFVALFYKPDQLLHYGETYRLDISSVRDFASNAAVDSPPDSLTFTTRPLPPLAAQDGFESVTSATLGGAQVLTGDGDPIISGTRSLYVPPASAVDKPPQTIQLALRLAVAPGDTAVRLTYRTVNPNALTSPAFWVAAVGGRISAVDASGPNGNGTFVSIGGTRMALGPIGTATIKLPADATDEIVFAAMVDATYLCNTPKPTDLPGIIIDDLRVE